MRYTVMIIVMPQTEVIEFTDVFADTDAAGEFNATVQGTRSARISTPDTV